MPQLIDTSVFVGLERRGLGLDDLPTVAPDEIAALATIMASELLAGLHRADSERPRVRREEFIEGILERLPSLPFDLVVARAHAQIWAQLVARGQLIGQHDLIIAATAMAHGYAVLTENLRDFRDFQRVPASRYDNRPGRDPLRITAQAEHGITPVLYSFVRWC